MGAHSNKKGASNGVGLSSTEHSMLLLSEEFGVALRKAIAPLLEHSAAHMTEVSAKWKEASRDLQQEQQKKAAQAMKERQQQALLNHWLEKTVRTIKLGELPAPLSDENLEQAPWPFRDKALEQLLLALNEWEDLQFLGQQRDRGPFKQTGTKKDVEHEKVEQETGLSHEKAQRRSEQAQAQREAVWQVCDRLCAHVEDTPQGPRFKTVGNVLPKWCREAKGAWEQLLECASAVQWAAARGLRMEHAPRSVNVFNTFMKSQSLTHSLESMKALAGDDPRHLANYCQEHQAWGAFWGQLAVGLFAREEDPTQRTFNAFDAVVDYLEWAQKSPIFVQAVQQGLNPWPLWARPTWGRTEGPGGGGSCLRAAQRGDAWERCANLLLQLGFEPCLGAQAQQKEQKRMHGETEAAFRMRWDFIAHPALSTLAMEAPMNVWGPRMEWFLEIDASLWSIRDEKGLSLVGALNQSAGERPSSAKRQEALESKVAWCAQHGARIDDLAPFRELKELANTPGIYAQVLAHRETLDLGWELLSAQERQEALQWAMSQRRQEGQGATPVEKKTSKAESIRARQVPARRI